MQWLLLSLAAAALLRGERAEQPCALPKGAEHHVQRHELSLIRRTASYQLFAAGAGEDASVGVYDCSTERLLLFLHIPKNAGSTIEDLGFGSGISWGWHLRDAPGPSGLKLPEAQTMPDGSTCTGWHVPPSQLHVAANPYENAEVFCVTRDPWERMQSEYVYLLACPWGDQMPFLRDGPECTSVGFNTFVQRSLQAMKQGRRWIDDCHLLPQWEFVEGPDGRQWCEDRLPLANLTASFNELMGRHGLSLRMGAHASRSAAAHCPALSATAPAELFGPVTTALMREVYAADLAHLGDRLQDLPAKSDLPAKNVPGSVPAPA